MSKGFVWRPPSKTEWRILRVLAEKQVKRIGLARELGLPASRITEALARLPGVKGKARKGLELDAELAGKIRQVNANFSGSRCLVAVALADNFKTVKAVEWATGLSQATVKRVLSALQKELRVFQLKKGVYVLRRREEAEPCLRLRALALQESGLFNETELEKVPATQVLCGRVFLCKNFKPLNGDFQLTGLSVFNEYGVELVSTHTECVSQPWKLLKEEALVHAIKLNEKDNRALGFCALFLLENKVDAGKARELADYFGCGRVAKKIMEVVEAGLQKEQVFERDYWSEENEAIHF
ncbi:hypothetical protein COX85_02225 [Candidatus Micrarchaeota archaeon CG_4_10_14_0_2_um_filter_55_9]|nr:MAG: hypothetical protein COX85_02225 [Candidatus Micrarchaeota archaeon CG_4_10_14_0_2_um_filter_55_9]PJD01483.1 MAG: hypothetical protein COU38_00945 [Candidatus Micrarchaeota archaeon CG10_big_fil_rev_8_21_14_0_10_54_18]